METDRQNPGEIAASGDIKSNGAEPTGGAILEGNAQEGGQPRDYAYQGHGGSRDTCS